MAKEIVYRKLVDLKKLPNNPRTIKKDDMERLKKSIKDNPDYFEARPIILSNRTGDLVILAGNQRYEAAKALKMDEVPTFLLEGLTEAREREIIIRDNVRNGDWDMDALANEWDTQELTDWGVDINWDEPEQEVVEDEAPEVNESEPAKSELGKVYKLGNHRLMCGDSTDAGSVAILMDGQKADIAFTSPPYNAGTTPTENAMGKKSKYENDSDDKSEEEYRLFLDKYIGACLDNSEYVFMNIQSLSNNKRALLGCMYDNIDNYADTIIWDKINAQPAMANNVLNSRFEYVHIFSNKANRAIGTVEFRGTVDNVIALPPQRKNEFAEEHNATFSLDFASWFIKNFAKESVLDSFGGTGTTLIACEQLGRKCYMMELDPKYCDVIRKRYWKFATGSEEGWQDGTSKIAS
jgi:DNA modification methylase